MSDANISTLERLLDIYENEFEVIECSFEIMGKLLDKDYLAKRINYLNIKKLYIYGGGYLGIQFYRTCDQLVEIPAIVDRQGCLQLDIKDVPVIKPDQLRKVYEKEIVIVASVRYYQEIRRELVSFVPKNKIIFLGEFMEGIL